MNERLVWLSSGWMDGPHNNRHLVTWGHRSHDIYFSGSKILPFCPSRGPAAGTATLSSDVANVQS